MRRAAKRFINYIRSARGMILPVTLIVPQYGFHGHECTTHSSHRARSAPLVSVAFSDVNWSARSQNLAARTVMM